jgi:hypothetical protein
MRHKSHILLLVTTSTALPYDWLGIGLARLAGAQIRQLHGVTLAHSGKLPVWLAHHPLGAMDAITLGRVVLASNPKTLHRTLTHELAHARQFQRWGIFFPLAYSAASIWSLYKGHGLYWGNTFEIAARNAERSKLDTLT